MTRTNNNMCQGKLLASWLVVFLLACTTTTTVVESRRGGAPSFFGRITSTRPVKNDEVSFLFPDDDDVTTTPSTAAAERRRMSPLASDTMMNPMRGGAALAMKTMTARRMETFRFLSGGVAGTVAACVTNPLEVIKTQLQSSHVVDMRQVALAEHSSHPVKRIAQTILKQDGVAGFFRGLAPTLVGIIPSRSAYFYAYHRCKALLAKEQGAFAAGLPEGSPKNALISGLLAGMVGNTLTNPIWMVRTRMQLLVDPASGQKVYNGYMDAITTIWKEESIAGFYKGIAASYWGCAEGALQFLVYEQVKSKLLIRQNKQLAAEGLPPSAELPKSTYFWAAAVSKGLAAIATYPHEVARTRLREQATSGMFKYSGGMWQTLGKMAAEEGPRSLYAGMGVHLLKVVPNSALMFLTYEVVRGWLEQFTVIDQ